MLKSRNRNLGAFRNEKETEITEVKGARNRLFTPAVSGLLDIIIPTTMAKSIITTLSPQRQERELDVFLKVHARQADGQEGGRYTS